MAIDAKLTQIIAIKNAIKQAIINKGVYVSDGDSFMTYATRIGQIDGGSSELFELDYPFPSSMESHDSGYIKACTFNMEDTMLYSLLTEDHGITSLIMNVSQGGQTIEMECELTLVQGFGYNSISAHSSNDAYSFDLTGWYDDEMGEDYFYFTNIVGFVV